MITASLEQSTNRAIVDWDAAVDDAAGSGMSAAGYNYRYRRESAEWSPWIETAMERAEIPGSFNGDNIEFQIAPRDAADNLAPARAATVTVAGTGDHCQPTASGVLGDCAMEADDPETGGDAPLESDFGPEAPELEPEDGADLEQPESTGIRALSFGAYRYTIRIRRRYAGEPGDGLSTTIRRYNNSFVIGNALDGWRFDLARRNYNSDFGYRAGRIYGGFGTCGWIRSGPVSAPPDGDTTTGCSPYFRPGVTPVVRSGACESSMRPRRWASEDDHDEANQAHSGAGHPQAARGRQDAG